MSEDYVNDQAVTDVLFHRVERRLRARFGADHPFGGVRKWLAVHESWSSDQVRAERLSLDAGVPVAVSDVARWMR